MIIIIIILTMGMKLGKCVYSGCLSYLEVTLLLRLRQSSSTPSSRNSCMTSHAVKIKTVAPPCGCTGCRHFQHGDQVGNLQRREDKPRLHRGPEVSPCWRPPGTARRHWFDTSVRGPLSYSSYSFWSSRSPPRVWERRYTCSTCSWKQRNVTEFP